MYISFLGNLILRASCPGQRSISSMSDGLRFDLQNHTLKVLGLNKAVLT